jgi:alkanesulfonate monooxygenase SsuD/methylene tetrahydromethanopterin reductase-like flavin-dependent oxidoreductase (luciferase family)
MTHAASLLATTDRLVVGTGIVNSYLRHAAPAEVASRTLVAMYPGRFVLGLGASHAPVLSRFGLANEKPLGALRDYLAQMNEVSDDIEGGAPRRVRILAALRSR